jgi:hypothetical protein
VDVHEEAAGGDESDAAVNGDPLQQLRDIHLPPPVGWWPPAPGWWLLAALALAALLALGWWLLRRHRRRRYRRLALAQAQHLYRQWQQQQDDGAYLQAINRLLKQTALAAYPRQQVAALDGADWLVFLDRGLRRPQFDAPALQPLAEPYRAAPAAVPAEQLRQAAEHWIRRHRC